MTTNYEKIKNMSIEEMAELLRLDECSTTCAFNYDCVGDMNCDDGIKQWLESEVSDEQKQ